MDTKAVFRLFILSLVACASLTTSRAHAQTISELEIAEYFKAANAGHDDEMMRVKTKDGRTISVRAPYSSRAHLEATSPAALRKAASRMRLNIEAQCSSGRNPVAQFGMDFVPESLKFYTAIGLSAGDQIKEDPAYGRHFVENSFLDPFGYASFAGFMLGSRGAASLMSMAGLTHDPCSLVKKYAGPAPLLEATRMQRLFSPLAGQIGMIAGLTVNNLVDALRDPNVVQCAALAIGKIPASGRAAADQACDTAYEDWVMNGGKLRDMMPDIASMTTIGLALASPQISMIAGKEGYALIGKNTKDKMVDVAGGLTLRFAMQQSENTLFYRGARLVMGVGKVAQFPVVRIAYEVGSMWVFFHFNDKLKPVFNIPFQTYWQNWDIEKTRAQIRDEILRSQQTAWAPTDKPGTRRCYADYGRSTGESAPVHCVSSEDKPAEAIALLGRQDRKWRTFLLADAMTSVSNWQNYVLAFTNLYTDAYKFYGNILFNVNFHSDPRARGNFEHLWDKVPFSGVPFDTKTWSGKICELVPKDKAMIDKAVTLLEAAINESKRPSVVLPKFSVGIKTAPVKYQTRGGAWHERTSYTPVVNVTNSPRTPIDSTQWDLGTLRQVLSGIRAMDCSLTPGLTDDQRTAQFDASLNTLYWTLAGPATWGLTVDSPEYAKRAWDNVFMQVNMVLGGPEPMSAGGGYIRGLNTNTDMINQDYKDTKPTHLENARTTQMTDYLLASMVCGPEATPSKAEKLTAANQDKLGWWARMKAVAGGNFQAPNPYTTKDMVSVQKYYEGHVSGDPSMANLGGLLKNDISLMSQVELWKADFRPPRIVKNLGFDPCAGDMQAAHISKFAAKFDGSNEPYTMDPYFTEWKVGKETVQGLHSFVKEFSRPEVLGASNFEKWWTANVEAHVQKVVDVYRQSFIEILNKKYAPVMMNPTRAKNGRAMGVTNSVIDSANSYLELLQPLLLTGANGKAAQTEMMKLDQQFMMRMRVQLMLTGPIWSVREGMQSIRDGQMPEQRKIQPKAPTADESHMATYVGHQANYEAVEAAYKFNQKQLAAVMNKMMKLASDQSKQLNGAAQQNSASMMKAIFENLQGLVTEIDSYWGVSVSIRHPLIDKPSN